MLEVDIYSNANCDCRRGLLHPIIGPRGNDLGLRRRKLPARLQL